MPEPVDAPVANDNKPDEKPVEPNEPQEPVGKLLNEQETSDWGNEATMVEPGQAAEEEAEEAEEPEEEPTEVIPPAPDPIKEEPLLEDPGEFKPTDHSFVVKDKDGRNVRISTPEEADAFAEDDENFKTAKDLKDFLRSSNKLESNIEREKADWETKKKAYDTQKEQREAAQAQSQQLLAEVQYLIDEGKLPAIPAKFQNSDMNDKEALKDPAIKQHLALIEYRNKQSDKRVKLGLPPMGIIEAYNALRIEQAESKTKEVKKEASKQRKEAAARVAPTAPAPPSNAPKGIMVGRGGSLRDLGGANWDV